MAEGVRGAAVLAGMADELSFTKPPVRIAAKNVRCPLSRSPANRFTAMTALGKRMVLIQTDQTGEANGISENRISGIGETVGIGAIGPCTKPRAQNAAKNAKSLSDPTVKNRFTAGIVLEAARAKTPAPALKSLNSRAARWIN